MRGLKQTAPMDGILVERAKREKKAIVYLEPAKLQMDLLQKWMDAKALKEMLDDTDGQKRQGELLDAPYVVMDEFHSFADRERGITARMWPLLDARTFADQFGTEESRDHMFEGLKKAGFH